MSASLMSPTITDQPTQQLRDDDPNRSSRGRSALVNCA